MSDAMAAHPHVEQCVEIDAPVDDVWHTLTDPAELAAWLDAEVVVDLEPGSVGHVVAPDGAVRQVLVTQVEPGHLLAWHWWADGGELSSVEITMIPVGDHTHVRVVECRAAASGTTVTRHAPGARLLVGASGGR